MGAIHIIILGAFLAGCDGDLDSKKLNAQRHYQVEDSFAKPPSSEFLEKQQKMKGLYKRLSVNARNGYAIDKDGDLISWGVFPTSHEPPREIGKLKLIDRMEQGGSWNRTCAVTISNQLRCWGLGANYRNPKGINNHEVEYPDDIGDVLDVLVVLDNTCVVTNQNKLRCWGPDGEDELRSPPSPMDWGSYLRHVRLPGICPNGQIYLDRNERTKISYEIIDSDIRDFSFIDGLPGIKILSEPFAANPLVVLSKEGKLNAFSFENKAGRQIPLGIRGRVLDFWFDNGVYALLEDGRVSRSSYTNDEKVMDFTILDPYIKQVVKGDELVGRESGCFVHKNGRVFCATRSFNELSPLQPPANLRMF